MLWNVLPPVGRYDAAAVVHDYLYQRRAGVSQHVRPGRRHAAAPTPCCSRRWPAVACRRGSDGRFTSVCAFGWLGVAPLSREGATLMFDVVYQLLNGQPGELPRRRFDDPARRGHPRPAGVAPARLHARAVRRAGHARAVGVARARRAPGRGAAGRARARCRRGADGRRRDPRAGAPLALAAPRFRVEGFYPFPRLAHDPVRVAHPAVVPAAPFLLAPFGQGRDARLEELVDRDPEEVGDPVEVLSSGCSGRRAAPTRSTSRCVGTRRPDPFAVWPRARSSDPMFSDRMRVATIWLTFSSAGQLDHQHPAKLHN
jgi:hypothetical protein